MKNERKTDVFLFCHGWNNDWKNATDTYTSFLQGYMSRSPSKRALASKELQ